MKATSAPPLSPLALRALLALAAVLAFVSSVPNGWVNIDDGRIILGQPFLRSVSPETLWRCLSPWPVREEFLPLRDLTYMLSFALWGERPLGFILENLALHAGMAVCVHALAGRIFVRLGMGEPWAFLAALVFAVHPCHVESVAWISGRKDALSGVFIVLSLCAYMDFLGADGPRRRRLYLLSALWGLAAFGSKASAVALPGLLLASDWLLVPQRSWLRRARDLAPFVLVTGAFALGYTWMLGQYAVEHGESVLKRHPEPWYLTVLFTNASVIRQYLATLLLPVGQHLFSDQPYRTVLDVEVAGSLGVLALAVGGSLALLRRSRPLALLPAWFFLPLVPFLNLAPHGIVFAERYVYLGSIGFALALAAALALLARARGRAWALALLLPYLAVCAHQSSSQCRVFQSGGTLWPHVLRAEPDNKEALLNLANWRVEQGSPEDLEAAAALYRRILELQPGKTLALYNLALVAERQGRLEEALAGYRAASHTRRDYVKAYYGAASVLAKQGRWELAATLYDEIIRRWPRAGARAAFNRALLLEDAGRDARPAWRAYLEAYGDEVGEAAFAARARERLGK